MFSLDLAKEGTSAVITVAGELDLATVDEFSECANASLLEPSTHKLVVDLRGVTFLDCTGLASLIDLQRRSEKEAKRFEMRCIPPRVTRLLDLSGMGNYFAKSLLTVTDGREGDHPQAAAQTACLRHARRSRAAALLEIDGYLALSPENRSR